MRNLTSNPAGANNATGVTASNGGTPVQVTGLGTAWKRTTGVKTTVSAAGTAQLLFPLYNAGAVMTTGQYCAGVVQWMLSAVPSGGANIILAAYNSSGTFLSNIASVAIANTAIVANTVYKTNMLGTAPANTQQIRVIVQANSAAASSTITASCCRTDLVNDGAIGYFDGASSAVILTAVWDGTAGGSTSTAISPTWSPGTTETRNSSSGPNGSNSFSNWVAGQEITVNTACWITKLWVYKDPQYGSGVGPYQAALYDKSATTQVSGTLATIDSDNSAATGWVSVSLKQPILLTAAKTYTLAVKMPSGTYPQIGGKYGTGTTGVTVGPVTYGPNTPYASSSTLAFPNTAFADGRWWMIDASFVTTSSSRAPVDGYWEADFTKTDVVSSGYSNDNQQRQRSDGTYNTNATDPVMPWPLVNEVAPWGSPAGTLATLCRLPDSTRRNEVVPNVATWKNGDFWYVGMSMAFDPDLDRFLMNTSQGTYYQTIWQMRPSNFDGSPPVSIEIGPNAHLWATGGAGRTNASPSWQYAWTADTGMTMECCTWYPIVMFVGMWPEPNSGRFVIWDARTDTVLLDSVPLSGTNWPMSNTGTQDDGSGYPKNGVYHSGALRGGTVRTREHRMGKSYQAVKPRLATYDYRTTQPVYL